MSSVGQAWTRVTGKGWREAGDSRKLQKEDCTGLGDWQTKGNNGTKAA